MNSKTQAAMALFCTMTTACVPTTPHLDVEYGESLATLRAQQTLNPDAPMANANQPVSGLEARAARETMDRYFKSYAVPPTQYGTLNTAVGSQGAASSQQ